MTPVVSVYENGPSVKSVLGRTLPPLNSPSPKFPLPQEGMALISLAKASLGARVFWLQGEGDSEQIEGALL